MFKVPVICIYKISTCRKCAKPNIAFCVLADRINRVIAQAVIIYVIVQVIRKSIIYRVKNTQAAVFSTNP